MSTSDAQVRVAKSRPYRLGQRAAKQQETRRRIVEAAVDLHGSIGPARTTIAQIAERAGVQRHTFYAHFPDDRSLMMACSGLSLERDPLPDAESWLAVAPGSERLRKGLDEIYGWYRRNIQLTACVLRDAEHHELTRETVALRMAPAFGRAAEVLAEGLNDQARSLLTVALDFGAWRALSGSASGEPPEALMSRAIALLNGS